MLTLPVHFVPSPVCLRAYISIEMSGGKWKLKIAPNGQRCSYRFAMKWARWENGVVLRAPRKSCRNALFIVKSSPQTQDRICLLAPYRFLIARLFKFSPRYSPLFIKSSEIIIHISFFIFKNVKRSDRKFKIEDKLSN